MGLLKKLFNKNKQPLVVEQDQTEVQNEKYINNLNKEIITNLRIIESQFYSIEYKIAHFTSLSSQEVETLYDSIHNIRQNIKTYKAFGEKYNLAKCIEKSDEALERIETLIDTLNRKLTGIVY